MSEKYRMLDNPGQWRQAWSMKWNAAIAAGAAAVGAVAIHDLTQKKHAITRNYPGVGHARFPFDAPTAPQTGEEVPLPSAKVMGSARGRAQAFRPPSVVNISGMSFGSLYRAAIAALNSGAN